MPGIIPACAGSTGAGRAFAVVHRDHPRVRGEHASTHSAGPVSGGSSPRARGAPTAVGTALVETGIIPACAGSTGCLQAARIKGRDHPRVRGEHLATCHMSAGA